MATARIQRVAWRLGRALAPLPTQLVPLYRQQASSLSTAPAMAAASSDSHVSSAADSSSHVLIDGKATAATIRAELKARVDALKAKTDGKAPGLAVILVGNRPDSATYVRMKKKACAEVGIEDVSVDLPETATEEVVIAAVRAANENPLVHGILVQLPLPKHISETRILSEISHEKDVDGLHPLNVGELALRGRKPRFVACTPRGCIELLKRYGIEISGKSAVVLGRSNIVGIPAMLLLMQENATVTVCHSRTVDIEERVRAADIVVAAIGTAGFVKGDWIKPGAAVIDVGINSVDDATKKRGYRLVGDVEFEEASKRAGAITPVPGGVGPMTIAMLLQNTVEAGETALL